MVFAQKWRHSSKREMAPTYFAWHDMNRRCEDERCNVFKHYGARGIRVCDRWQRDYDAFVDDMGIKPNGRYSLERKDNEGNYEPQNCRWATQSEQRRNTRVNRFVSFRGERLTVTDAAAKAGIHLRTVMARLNRGWPEDRALGATARSYEPKGN